ncbi:UDP-N-acetylmuramoyl-L-alanine--D-glutamate ligase [Chloroflexus sp.]|uniref:UDP-N-acetylmuramoyl-L-alanine--D-glutamate ligase n=1 Tax=Chloroflexus sp. TaxID=1904827 RepID=UPI002ACDFB1D|nr:UDP-N-acetylmuramoyl-L-alanine--D-glutamate ligase [Chloroflexus sp.]
MVAVAGKRVLVMGLGVHGGGLGVARWLLRHGAKVTVTDLASAEALAEPIARLDAFAAELGAQVSYTLGEHRAEDIRAAEMLVVNPAVRPDSPWLALARSHGVPIETEMTLFFRACPGPILGVTGTKGKTTTTLLLAAMIRQRYPDTVAAGNLRVSALEALDQIGPQTPVVLELSSFQLERLGEAQLSPPYALLTNLGNDHLNWHGSLAAYANAKRQIMAHQRPDGIAVLPPEQAREWGGGRQGVISYSLNDLTADATVMADGTFRYRDVVLFRRSDLRLPGEHNAANALAAATLAYQFGIDPAAIAAALHTVTGIEHRLELVATIEGVRYINDTTATNPAATAVALATVPGPIVLLAGGADKNLDLAALATTIANRAAAVVLLAGSATPTLQALLQAQAPVLPVSGPFDDLRSAVQAARALAQPGGAVLLSPGCASFGMFRNEFHRGEAFRHIVRELAAVCAGEQAHGTPAE